MKKIMFLLAAGLFTASAIAQELPQPSQLGKVEQRVGLTDLKIEYSRPNVKGRKVFGELVAYDKVWRLGANAPTMLTTSTEMTIQGATIDAGTYAVFAFPSETGAWKFVFNTDIEQWGAGNYDEKKNVAEAMAKPQVGEMTETLTIGFTNITNNSGMITVMWDKMKLEIGFDVPTIKLAEASIKTAIDKGEDLDKVYYNAASYYFKSMKDDKKALSLIAKGIEVKDGFKLHFLRAQILNGQGKTKDAVKEAGVAHKMALAAEEQGWADYIKRNMDSWNK